MSWKSKTPEGGHRVRTVYCSALSQEDPHETQRRFWFSQHIRQRCEGSWRARPRDSCCSRNRQGPRTTSKLWRVIGFPNEAIPGGRRWLRQHAGTGSGPGTPRILKAPAFSLERGNPETPIGIYLVTKQCSIRLPFATHSNLHSSLFRGPLLSESTATWGPGPFLCPEPRVRTRTLWRAGSRTFHAAPTSSSSLLAAAHYSDDYLSHLFFEMLRAGKSWQSCFSRLKVKSWSKLQRKGFLNLDLSVWDLGRSWLKMAGFGRSCPVPTHCTGLKHLCFMQCVPRDGFLWYQPLWQFRSNQSVPSSTVRASSASLNFFFSCPLVQVLWSPFRRKKTKQGGEA